MHTELLRLATSEANGAGGPGEGAAANAVNGVTASTGTKPAVLRLSAQVVGASAEGKVVLADESRHTADLVVAADGVHSVLREAVVGREGKAPEASGHSAFRFLIDTEAMRADKQMAAMLEKKGDGTAILIEQKGTVGERQIIRYPCREYVTLADVAVLLARALGRVG